MLCETWDELYDRYEAIALQRMERKKQHKVRGPRFPLSSDELDRLNLAIADALRRLREHERQHGCRYL